MTTAEKAPVLNGAACLSGAVWNMYSDGRVVRDHRRPFVNVMTASLKRRGRHAFAQPAAASPSVFASAPPIAVGRSLYY